MTILALKIENKSGFPDDQVNIGFVPGTGAPCDISYQSPSTIEPLSIDVLPLNIGASYPFAGNWYKLSDLPDSLAISAFSGRVYVAYQTPWSVEGKQYEPGQAVTDPNFFLRYDKMEMTFTGNPADVANLTSIDYWSIPMSLKTSKNGAPAGTVQGLLNNAKTQDVYDALLSLTTPPVSGLPGVAGNDGTPIPALVPGQFVQYDPSSPAPGNDFARIIGPSSYPSINPQGIPVLPYDTFEGYLSHLNEQFGTNTTTGAVIPGLGNGVIAKIAGKFAGVGSDAPSNGPLSKQTYDLTAKIDAQSNITLSGTVGNGAKHVTMAFAKNDLINPSGIYGANAPFSLDGAAAAPPVNNVYGWISGDLLAGINIGAIGSSVSVGKDSPKMVGSMPSHDWFNLPNSLLFGGLQTSKTYNQWAAKLAPLSQAYNFAYSDRFAHVFASLNPAKADELKLVLEPGNVVMS
tara:strand:- start:415969 stop:417348 length:1380 start_codon:yes stop_codon:yes gene_type:complete